LLGFAAGHMLKRVLPLLDTTAETKSIALLLQYCCSIAAASVLLLSEV
jgi:hypothetical protein